MTSQLLSRTTEEVSETLRRQQQTLDELGKMAGTFENLKISSDDVSRVSDQVKHILAIIPSISDMCEGMNVMAKSINRVESILESLLPLPM